MVFFFALGLFFSSFPSKAMLFDTPANEFFKRYKEEQLIKVSKYDYKIQLLSLKDKYKAESAVFHILVDGKSIHVLPLFPRNVDYLSEWEVQGTKVTEWKIKNNKRIKMGDGSLHSKVFLNVILSDMIINEWQNDYVPEMKSEGRDEIVLDLKKKAKSKNHLQYSRIQVNLEKSTSLPKKIDFFESKKIAKTYHFKKYMEIMGKFRPKIIEISAPTSSTKSKDSSLQLTYYNMKRTI